MKTLAIILALMFTAPASSVYDFKLTSIDGKEFSLSKYKGKKLLIVNTASECGFTPQYAELQKLADQYKDKLVVIGFPANNFGGQEPGANAEIKTFCQKNYGVTFPLNEKISVKGDDIHPLFKFLTSEPNPDFTGEIKWNFEKFLIDENGKLIHRYRSATKPLSPEITGAI
ncbi:glutathione peroxidase [Mucilaginibacter limnophilus]|uniref:Glutathione peroxidase n=1 Tax=Mucilaginibacter limnophilus TaxID=1932778 RepID=A0A437MUF3_9SPHI|nr:glutathione peroxidase [Mucilaginibacter limnophilus]RVU01291.1 glutathione peroxidase [Mucilaginibacter limnophilus]